MEALQIQMLGQFSIEAQGRRLDASEDRSQKPWLMLAYLLYHRDRVVTQEELLRLCWRDEEIKGDPANALRVVLHRTRTMLDKLEVMPGRELIVRSREGFGWNERLSAYVDVEEFEGLYQKGVAAADREEKRACFERAVALYKGGFLGRSTGEGWIQCVAEHLRKRYMEMACELLDICCASGELERSAALCRSILTVEPFNEAIYRRLMRALLKRGQAREAAQVYEQLRRDLLTKFDRVPEAASAETYFDILKAANPASVPVAMKRLDIMDNEDERGAKLCDFTFYRMFYSSAEWLIVQCGLKVYDVLFTVQAKPDRNVSERTWERLMETLTQQLRAQWHRGDALARCADDQIVGMIQADTYEKACLICEQQVEKFYRDHPNTPVSLSYGVWRVGGERS